MTLHSVLFDPLIMAAFREDLGDRGDITSEVTLPPDLTIQATMRARKAGIIAGTSVALRSFEMIDRSLHLNLHRQDGDKVNAGEHILTITGNARSILTAERVALNFMGHLSGIATATYQMVQAIAGTKAKIADTRKTTPGLRGLEKQAVRAGGGVNHRFGLYDAVLIKDNHIAAMGGIAQALTRARSSIGHMVKIEIEVDSLEQLQQVCDLNIADCVLLDNMDQATLKKAVDMVKGRLTTEASGNVSLNTVVAIAQSGVDYISSGWLTHSSPNLDLGLDII